MKICLISNLFPPIQRGGAEKVAEETALELSKKHDIFIISTKPKGWKIEKKKNDKLRIYRFSPLNIYYYLNDYRHNAIVRLIWHLFDQFNLHSYLTVKKILKKEKPDLIISHNLMGLGFLAARALKKYKWIHVLHDVQLIVPSGLIIKNREKSFITEGFLIKIYLKINKFLFNSPNKIISPSAWLLNFYEKKDFFPKSKKKILPNPISFESAGQIKQTVRQPVRLLFIGQIQEHKGIIFLTKTLNSSNLEFKLMIAGAGNKENEMQTLISQDSRFEFVGQVSSDQIIDLLGRADYLILPSQCYENSPKVIYEAFSQARPVIGADIGGISELVEENKTGFLFEPANANSLLKAVKKATNTEYYGEMGKNCLDSIKKHNTVEYVKNLLD